MEPEPLTLEKIQRAVESTCLAFNAPSSSDHSLWTFRWAHLPNVNKECTPLFGLQADWQGTPYCLTTFYFAYSTWDGRFIYIDVLADPLDVVFSKTKEHFGVPVGIAAEQTCLLLLTRIAVALGCSRLTWQHDGSAIGKTNVLPTPEFMEGWLTLHWEEAEMSAYAGLLAEVQGSDTVEECIRLSLRDQDNDKYRLRLATIEDSESITRLVEGLAIFEMEPDAVHVSINHYKVDGFGSRPLFYCLLLDFAEGGRESQSCGMAFFYIGCTIKGGRFMYLEDLFVEEFHRGKGAGSVAMKTLASAALAMKCQRLVWQALDWNTPALAFYNKIGAKIQTGLLTSRYANRQLYDLAKLEIAAIEDARTAN